jgi:hypothetical protein
MTKQYNLNDWRVSKTNSIAKGLKTCLLPGIERQKQYLLHNLATNDSTYRQPIGWNGRNEGSGDKGYLTNSPWGPAWEYNPNQDATGGNEQNTNYTYDRVWSSLGPLQRSWPERTLLVHFRPRTTPQDSHAFATGPWTGDRQTGLFVYHQVNASTNPYWRYEDEDDLNYSTYFGTGKFTANNWQSFAVTSSQSTTTVAIYANGIFANSNTSVVPNDTPAVGSIKGIGGDGLGPWDGAIFSVYEWDRVLTPSEIFTLSQDPVQIFEPETLYVPFNVEPTVEEPAVDDTELVTYFEKPWTRQPPPGTEIDWSNPITRGLLFFAPADSLGRDAVSGEIPTSNGAGGSIVYEVNNSPIREGWCFDTRGSTEAGDAEGWYWGTGLKNGTFPGSFKEKLDNSTNITTITWARRESKTTDWAMYFGVAKNGPDYYQGCINQYDVQDNLAPRIEDSSGDFTNVVTNTNPLVTRASGVDMYASTIADGGAATRFRVYVNGQLNYSADSGTVRSIELDGNWGIVANAYAANADCLDGITMGNAIWNRELSAAEVASLYKNPWQIFQPKKLPVFREKPTRRLLTHKKPWIQQPPAQTPLDWTNPITRNLVGAFTGADGFARNLVTGVETTRTSNITKAPNNGEMQTSVQSDGAKLVTDIADLSGDQTFVLRWTRKDGTDSHEYLVGASDAANNEGTGILAASADGNIWWHTTGDWVVNTTGFFVADGETVDLAYAFNTTTGIKVYGDGVEIDSSATGGAQGTVNPVQMFERDEGWADGHGQGYMPYVFIFARTLTQKEIQSLHENPWQIFEPQTISVPYDYVQVETTSEEEEERLFIFERPS